MWQVSEITSPCISAVFGWLDKSEPYILNKIYTWKFLLQVDFSHFDSRPGFHGGYHAILWLVLAEYHTSLRQRIKELIQENAEFLIVGKAAEDLELSDLLEKS